MAPTREQILSAWAKWDAAQPMTAEEQALLTTDATGARHIPDDPHAAQMKAFLAEHGHKPVTHKALSDLMQGQAEIFADVIRPLRRRIDALEAEVRAGHARVLALEAEQEDYTDAD
ncbi:hypothetical protein Q4543_04695 [Salipiger sp. 1_MG-2023]|uniref:hypothetical protein n=1 Tax=Salipiger sp. 1_MG-2023 TaxID=3062665 RepID=UPI0026E22B7D|nr:hypothetical protein [Salipiger sp. 1_MG-2023]MDO6584810.1 hypothetical protein [Salipiger sp. 1_MG-2023]